MGRVHPIISQMRLEYKKPEKSYPNWNLIQPVHNKGLIRISVSKKMISRTLKFLNSFLNEIERNNGEIMRGSGFLEIKMNEETIKFGCREQTKKVKNTNKDYHWYEYELIPTGLMILQIDILGQKEWKDGKLKIEERIDEIIKYCKEQTLYLKSIHDKRKRENRKEEIERWFQLKKQRNTENEIIKIKELIQKSVRYQKTKILKQFIDDYENLINKSDKNKIKELEWMKEIFNWYNPITSEEIDRLIDVNKETLELNNKCKDYLNNKFINVNSGDENELLKELNQILLKENEDEKKVIKF